MKLLVSEGSDRRCSGGEGNLEIVSLKCEAMASCRRVSWDM